MVPPIVFLRHGETDWNVEGRLQGRRDIPLNATGRVQARQNGARVLARIPDIGSYHAVASPLIRSRETMEIARNAMQLEPGAYALDDRLQEIAYGDWEGFTNDELRERDPALVEARDRDKWRFLPPNGESYHLLAERVDGWLKGLTRETFVVSHGGVGRVLRMLLLGADPAEVVMALFPQDKALVVRDGKAEWI
jgi:probable phosphoglycerate mutase